MKKIILVTYNPLQGIPIGRYQCGNVTVYSGDYGKAQLEAMSLFEVNETTLDEAVARAEAEVLALKQQIVADTANIDEAYVYVGMAAIDGAMKLLQELKNMGKAAHMIACPCNFGEKSSFANKIHIDWVMSECGGERTCARIIRELTQTTLN